MATQKFDNEEEQPEIAPSEDEEEVGGEFVDFWHPETKHDELRGVVISIGESEFGIYADIETEEGLTFRTPAHKILQNRLEKLQEGDFVRIVYEGRIRTKSGRWAENYRVFRRKVPDEKQQKLDERSETQIVQEENER